MRQKLRRILAGLLVFALAAGGFMPGLNAEKVEAAAKATNAKIHFLNLSMNCDAILLECNGAFGMVDSGEDNGYPNGKNKRYPWRAGITKGKGVEDEVVDYLESLGVERLDFYIATHPHSDHIGNAHIIIKRFKPKRVYVRPYKDSYITNKLYLWDNLYVYDNLINAVKEVNAEAESAEDGITLIQYFNKSAAYVDPLRKDKTGAVKSAVSSNTKAAVSEVSKTGTSENVGSEEGYYPEALDAEEDSGVVENAGTTEDTDEIGDINVNEEIPVDEAGEIDSIASETEITGDSSDEPESEEPAAGHEETPAAVAPAGTLSTEDASAVDVKEVLGDDVTDLDEMTVEDMEAETEANLELAGLAEDEVVGVSEEVTDQTPFQANTASDVAPIKLSGNSKAQTAKPKFTLGDGMTIEIMNYDAKLKAPDANYFCLGVKVTANGSKAFLAGDINNYTGTEDKLAKQLGRVDVLKLGHHGYYGSNSTNYLKKLKPSIAILMGTSDHCQQSMFDTLSSMGTRVYMTPLYAKSTPATIINMNARVNSNISSSQTLSQKVVSAYSNELMRYVLYKNGKKYVGSGWVTANSKLYYFDPKTKVMKTQKWFKTGNKYYYFKPGGAAATGWYQVENKWYYFNSAGVMQTGWLTDGNKVYYLNSSGAMAVGEKKIGSYYYCFKSNGTMATGWLNNKFYNEKGRWVKNQPTTGWQKDSKGYWWRYSNGSYAKNTWKVINGNTYYFNSKGYRVTGFNTIKGKKYYFAGNGVRYTNKWLVDGSRIYRFGNGGVMVTGRQTIKGKKYYFAANGVRYTSKWLVDGSKIYYYGKYGVMVTGRQTIKEKEYYFASNGVKLVKQWQTIGGKKYYFGAGGVMVTGLQTIDGKTYYFQADGAMATGWQTDNDKTYYFGSTGELSTLTGWQTIDSRTYYFNNDYSIHTGWLALEEEADGTGNVPVTNHYYFYTQEYVAANPELSLTAGEKAVSTQLQLPSWTDETIVREYTFDENGMAQEGDAVVPEVTETPASVDEPVEAGDIITEEGDT